MGLYRHGRKYRTRSGNRWVCFAGPYEAACRAFRQFRQSGDAGYRGSVAALLDWYLSDIAPTRLRPRTLADYRYDAEMLKRGLGHIPATMLGPEHIAVYRDERAVVAPGHVNHELSVLRIAYQFAAERGRVQSNPAREVRKVARRKRERLITDAEFLAVHEQATPSGRIAMLLALRTLQRPQDVLAFGPQHVAKLDDGRRVLRFVQQKTQSKVDILLEGELARVIDEHRSLRTYVHTARGHRYGVNTFSSMFRKWRQKAGVDDFGLRDLRAKGATDMYRDGVPLRVIQTLLGHRSPTMTERYLKSLVPELARPNDRAVGTR